MMVESVCRIDANMIDSGVVRVLLRLTAVLIKHFYRTYQFFEIKY
jgi:hypothetical protein